MVKRAAASRASASTAKARGSKARASSIPAASSSVPAEPSREQIERRAFELFLSRGASDGDALGDWLRAESELRAMA